MATAQLLEVKREGSLYTARIKVDLDGKTIVIAIHRLIRKPVEARLDEEEGRKVIHLVDEKGEVFACTLALEE